MAYQTVDGALSLPAAVVMGREAEGRELRGAVRGHWGRTQRQVEGAAAPANEAVDWAVAPSPCPRWSVGRDCGSETGTVVEAEVEAEAAATLERSQNESFLCRWDSQHTEDWRGPAVTGEGGQEWRTGTETLTLGVA